MDDLNDIKGHGVFSNLPTFSNKVKVSEGFLIKWVKPFYLSLNCSNDDWIERISLLKNEITDDIILKNLGEFNWRTRSTGSFFASIKNKKEFTEIIGNHLLKNEVCYAGEHYAITLAHFNTKKSIEYLNEYLYYYLLHPELPFDQRWVIATLKFLDNINKTNLVSKHIDFWKRFTRGEIEFANEYLKSAFKLLELPNKGRHEIFKMLVNCDIDYKINTFYIEKKIKTIQSIVNYEPNS